MFQNEREQESNLQRQICKHLSLMLYQLSYLSQPIYPHVAGTYYLGFSVPRDRLFIKDGEWLLLVSERQESNLYQ